MTNRKRIGELLVEAGVIDEAMLRSALGHQRRWGGRLGQALLELKMITEGVLVDTLAKKSGFEVARLGELEPYSLAQALQLVPREFAERHNVFPMAADTTTLTLAMADPINLSVTDELRFRSGRRIKVCIGGDREIAEAIRARYPRSDAIPGPIALDLDAPGEGVPLAAPFVGGSSQAMRESLEQPRPPPVRTPAVLSSAAPQSGRPAVPPPPIQSASPRPQGGPPGAAAPTARGARLAPGSLPELTPTGGRPLAPSERTSTGARLLGVPVLTPTGARPLAAAPAPPARAAPPPAPAPPATAPAPPATAPAPAPLADGELLPVDLLAAEEEMVEGRIPMRELSARDLAVLDALERMARGEEVPASPVPPGRLAAVLLRLLVRKRLLSEDELLDELSKP